MLITNTTMSYDRNQAIQQEAQAFRERPERLEQLHRERVLSQRNASYDYFSAERDAKVFLQRRNYLVIEEPFGRKPPNHEAILQNRRDHNFDHLQAQRLHSQSGSAYDDTLAIEDATCFLQSRQYRVHPPPLVAFGSKEKDVLTEEQKASQLETAKKWWKAFRALEHH